MIEILVSQSINGLVLGVLYVLVSVGLSVIFGMLGIVNFAHGVFFALGAYLALTLQAQYGWTAVVLAPVGVGLIGIAVEYLLIRRLYGKEPLLVLVFTFALSLFVEAIVRTIWGGGGQPFSVPPSLQGIVEVGPAIVTTYRVAVLATTLLILLALWLLLTQTPYGRILRAGSRDPEMVSLLGINMPWVFTGAFGFGCLLAGTAGLLAAPLWSVSPTMAVQAVIPAFIIVTIGGLGSYVGAIVAGLLVGLATSFTVQFSPQAASAAMYVLMVAVLLLRPRGLFGERWERFE